MPSGGKVVSFSVATSEILERPRVRRAQGEDPVAPGRDLQRAPWRDRREIPPEGQQGLSRRLGRDPEIHRQGRAGARNDGDRARPVPGRADPARQPRRRRRRRRFQRGRRWPFERRRRPRRAIAASPQAAVAAAGADGTSPRAPTWTTTGEGGAVPVVAPIAASGFSSGGGGAGAAGTSRRAPTWTTTFRSRWRRFHIRRADCSKGPVGSALRQLRHTSPVRPSSARYAHRPRGAYPRRRPRRLAPSPRLTGMERRRAAPCRRLTSVNSAAKDQPFSSAAPVAKEVVVPGVRIGGFMHVHAAAEAGDGSGGRPRDHDFGAGRQAEEIVVQVCGSADSMIAVHVMPAIGPALLHRKP